MALLKKLGKKGGKNDKAPPPLPEPDVKTCDKRLPFENYREFFTLKNYWKSVDRKRTEASTQMLYRYLTQNPDHLAKYGKFKNLSIADKDKMMADPTFEAVAGAYLKVFDDVIAAVEEKPNDAQPACDRLMAVGKMHRAKVQGMDSGLFQAMEEPFLRMVSDVLQDRYNDKAENLFRKFYQFCLKYLAEGYNS